MHQTHPLATAKTAACERVSNCGTIRIVPELPPDRLIGIEPKQEDRATQREIVFPNSVTATVASEFHGPLRVIRKLTPDFPTENTKLFAWGQRFGALILREAVEHTKAEGALRENQRVFSTLLNNLPGAACRYRNDTRRTMEFISEGCLELTGYSPGEFLSNSKTCFGHLIVPEDRQPVWERVQAALQARTSFELHYRIRTASGVERWIRERGQGLFSTQNELLALQGFIIDVTETRQTEEAKSRLEAQLRQAQKVESLGWLAGGIAHDLNNMLAAMMTYTELAQLDANAPDDVRKHLAEIRKASDRAKELVRQILTFSRQQNVERKPSYLPLIVKDAAKFLRSTLPATLEIDLQIDADTPLVLADPTQIYQVMMNLCANAAHAMRECPGRLTVILRSCEVNETLAQSIREVHPGTYARLSVTDTGHGMSAETLKRIFEPFFTTKCPGEGTGLGLSVVQRIVREHQGGIVVRSELGVGTTFDLYFPIQQNALIEIPQVQSGLPRGKGEHILFVDDEPAICASTRLILARFGYRVTAQTSPDEALRQFRSGPDEFALVITDLTMPRITGLDLAREISQLRPRTPVLLTSGFGNDVNFDKLRECGVRDLIAKPMTLLDLAAAVHRALTEAVRGELPSAQ